MDLKLFTFHVFSIYFLTCDSANILGVIPSCSFSHQIAFVNVWKELARRGHNVTVLTTNPQNDSTLPNLKEIDLSIGYKLIEEKHNFSQNLGGHSPLGYFNFVMEILYDLTEVYLLLPEVQDLFSNESYDVVMVEYIFAEWLILGEIFDAPIILLTSFDAPITAHRHFQNPAHPILYPETYIPYAGELSFEERLTVTLLSWVFDYLKQKNYLVRQINFKKYYEKYSTSINELIEKSSLLFVQVNPALLVPRPLGPRTINIGGGSTINLPKKLPQDIQDFLDSADNGSIYFSLGSNAKSENQKVESIKNIIEVFSQLPYKVLWKFSNKDGYQIPNNVKIVEWVSQQDVLRHPNIRLFVTQGGIQSLEEAIYFEIPLVGIPIFADQESNIKRLQTKGILKMVSPKPFINSSILKEAILEVITNETYKENVKTLNLLSLDQPMTGLDKAVWWTEYIIRNKGKVDHFIHDYERAIPFYQYYLLDVISFLILVVLFVLGIIYAVSRILTKLICNCGKRNTVNTNKKYE